MQARMECEMTGGVISRSEGAVLRPQRMNGVFGAPALTRILHLYHSRRVYAAFSYSGSPNKTHPEERLCLDPQCNVFHMCSPSPTSHPHVSPILAPSCQCLPFFFFAHHTFSCEKEKKKNPKKLDLTFTCAHDRCALVRCACKRENLKNREKGASHSETPNSNILFPLLTGEGEEVHAPSGQPEGP